MNSYSWREREDKSSSVKAKVLKSKLYFLGNPKQLQNNDVLRHVCKGCKRVFHKSQGLEWHVMDEHPHLLEETRKDLGLITADKGVHPAERIIPERRAAFMGEKKRKSSVDLIRDHVKHDENSTYSDADISDLLKSSEDEDNLNDEIDPQECKVRLEKQLVIKKDFNVKIPKLSLTGANYDCENVESDEKYTNVDELIETASDSSVYTSSAQEPIDGVAEKVKERECYVKLQNLRLAWANDDRENVENDEKYTDNDESIIIMETASDSSVVELSPSSHQLSNQLDTSAAQEIIENVAESKELRSLAPVMVDKVQW